MKKILLFMFILLFFVSIVSAKELVDVTGRVVDDEGNPEMIVGTTLMVDGERINEVVDIDNENGVFTFRDVDMSKTNNLVVESNCFYHSFEIKEQGGKYYLRDSMDSGDGIFREKSNPLNLGRLEEDSSVMLNVDSDDKVSLLVQRSNGDWVAENMRYSKRQGHFSNMEPNTNYDVILETEKGKKFETSFTTGNYCQGTRIIKRGNYFEVENFERNIFPALGFMQKVKLFFKGLF